MVARLGKCEAAEYCLCEGVRLDFILPLRGAGCARRKEFPELEKCKPLRGSDQYGSFAAKSYADVGQDPMLPRLINDFKSYRHCRRDPQLSF